MRNLPLIEQAWRYYFSHARPEDLRYIRISIAEEALQSDPWVEKPIAWHEATRSRYQDFTPHDLLRHAKEKTKEADAANMDICKMLHVDPRSHESQWGELTKIIALTIEDGTRARQDLEAFRKAVREYFEINALGIPMTPAPECLKEGKQ